MKYLPVKRIFIILVILCSMNLQAIAGDPGYKLAAEDVLHISVWKEEGLQQDVLIRPDGKISFPLVGAIEAGGKTAEEVRLEITTKLIKFIPDPVVTVSIVKVSGNKIYVIGKVNRPGEFVVGRYIDVMQALALAGGVTPYASTSNIKVLRRNNGNQEVFKFEYNDVKNGENLEQNIVLQAGDSVVVP